MNLPSRELISRVRDPNKIQNRWRYIHYTGKFCDYSIAWEFFRIANNKRDIDASLTDNGLMKAVSCGTNMSPPLPIINIAAVLA